MLNFTLAVNTYLSSCEWVRERGFLSLPVVAIGSIPYIYRRAAFPHRATPAALPT